MKLSFSSFLALLLLGPVSHVAADKANLMTTLNEDDLSNTMIDAADRITTAVNNFRHKANTRMLETKAVQETRRLAEKYRAPSDVSPHIDDFGRRRLQDDQCVPSVIYEDDDDNLFAFASKFQPSCMCDNVEPNFNNTFNDINITAIIIEEGITDIDAATDVALQAVADVFNDALKETKFKEEAMCSNDCASCYGGSCAYLDNTDKSEWTMVLERDMTVEDARLLVSDTITEEQEDQFFQDIFRIQEMEFFTEECYHFVSGDHDTGKGCFALSFDLKPATAISFEELLTLMLTAFESATVETSIDGTNCKSCEIGTPTDPEDDACVKCDCTNIYDNAMPNDCVENAKETFDHGILAPMYDFSECEGECVGSNYTLGECGNRPDDDDKTSAAAGVWNRVVEGGVLGMSILASAAVFAL